MNIQLNNKQPVYLAKHKQLTHNNNQIKIHITFHINKKN